MRYLNLFFIACIWAIILFWAASAFAEDKTDVQIIQELVKDGKAQGYTDDEIRLAILSNIMLELEPDDAAICFYLPELSECSTGDLN